MAGKRYRFVVLEHVWNGVHWDFMLESGTGLRTWAIDAPIVPEILLPARALPDHRPVYLHHEGPISNDRGSVQRIDQGTYQVVDWGTTRVVVTIQGERFSGQVELVRKDEREIPERAGGWTFLLGKVD